MHKTRSFIVITAALTVLISVFILLGVYGAPVDKLENAAGTAIMPVERAFNRAAVFFHGIYLRFTGYDELLEENIRLKEQLAQSRDSVLEAAALITENQQLRRLSGLSARSRELELLPAEITGTYGGGYELDKGADDGILSGMCVISSDGMAGIISRCGDNWSVMTAINSVNFSLSARNVRTRETYAAAGCADGGVGLEDLLPTSMTREGDSIVSSGQGGIFPPDIAIGIVSAVYDADDGLSRRAELKPAADIKELSDVYVVTAFEVEK